VSYAPFLFHFSSWLIQGSSQAAAPEENMKKQGNYPPGWNEARVHRVLAHYEAQTETEAVAEDEAAFENRTKTAMEVPVELVPVVRELIAKHRSKVRGQSPD
jgi:hypothetical protein